MTRKKYCGTAAKAGGNGENKPHPNVKEVPFLLKGERKKKQGSRYETTRKISVTGIYSYYVTIPKDYIDALDWKEGQTVNVTVEGKQIVIKKAKGKGGTTKQKK